jgi:ribosomal protein S18 acetylase RimI-like enzyme
MIDIKIAESAKDLQLIEQLADAIWREHYIPIIGSDQVVYMLAKYQVVESMKDQIRNGSFYYIIYYNKKSVGYLSFSKDDDVLFLSKIYVLLDFRGKKIGKKAMSFIENKTKELGLSKIHLGVNKYNVNTIQAYEKLGFKNIGPSITDIGAGFIMDDFKMEKVLSNNSK